MKSWLNPFSFWYVILIFHINFRGHFCLFKHGSQHNWEVKKVCQVQANIGPRFCPLVDFADGAISQYRLSQWSPIFGMNCINWNIYSLVLSAYRWESKWNCYYVRTPNQVVCANIFSFEIFTCIPFNAWWVIFSYFISFDGSKANASNRRHKRRKCESWLLV